MKALWHVGSRGATVTLERRGKRRLYLRWWGRSKSGTLRWQRRSLKHGDVEAGKQAAKDLSAELLAGELASATGRRTVTQLLALYERDVSPHKKGTQPTEDKRRAAIWQAVLGGREADTLDHDDLDAFVRDRRAGRITVEEHELRGKVTDTTIGADIIFLNSVLNWATRKKLLAVNPVRGFKRPKSANPKQPVATYDRFEKIVAVADRVDPFFGVFLALVEALGWRVTAICQLQADDVDRRKLPNTPYGRIHKRRETDKEGMDRWVPLSKDARAALDRLPTIGGYLFANVAGIPWSRWHARDLLERAEKLAELEPLEGSDFHAYRRKWATERKHLPDADVMAAGDWRDPRSLKGSYQKVDAETLLAVVTEPKKLREAK